MMQRSSEDFSRRQFLSRLSSGTALGLTIANAGVVRSLHKWSELGGFSAPSPPPEPYHMVVFGDSVAWGQGLRDDEKFSTLVAQWLTARLGGRKVVKWTFAHSGAVIGPAEQDGKKPLPSEVPVPFPSILAQVMGSSSFLANPPSGDLDHSIPVRPEHVSLVLVNGGINDVDVRNILTCDPTIEHPESWIRGLAQHRCVERMRDVLLPRLLSTFMNAQVIVTGYYEIVSDETRLGDLETFLGHLGLLGVLGSAGVSELVRHKLAGQCAAFADQTTTGLAEIVPQAQPLRVVANAITSSLARPPQTNSVGATLQGKQQAPGRAHFVSCRLTPDESYGASHSQLWGIPATDPLAEEREQQCNSLGATVDHLTCIEASAGHPNLAGARLIADRIIARLNCLLNSDAELPADRLSAACAVIRR